MKSTIIKVVTQTQFETCVSAFIALVFKLRWGKVVRMGSEIISLFGGYFLMKVKIKREDSVAFL